MCVVVLAGPFVSALANRYGFRLVAILGSVISCSAFVLSYFSTSIEFLYISYGVLGKFLPYIQGGASERVFKYSRGSWKLWTLLRTEICTILLLLLLLLLPRAFAYSSMHLCSW